MGQLLAIVAVAFALLWAFSDDAHGNPAFCTPKKPARDFGLSKLPPVREVPESTKALGHGAVDIYGSHRAPVMTEPSPFGYWLSEHNYSGSGVLLNWTVTAQLWTIDRHGAAFREVDHEKLSIRRLNAANQPYISVDPLEDRRGFYRFNMQIANQSGRVIGSYGAYFKVVRSSWRPRLRLNRDTVTPGQRILTRIENYGSELVSYAEPFSVQRFDHGQWTFVPGLTPHAWRRWLRFLDPGGIGGCSSLTLPADVPPGRYRIGKDVGALSWPDGRKARLTAPFEVVSPGAAEIEY